MIKKGLLVVLAAFLIAPAPASALQIDEVLSLVAMPLAVAAVAEMTDVPVQQLVDVVALLNEAEVRPAQFVEIVRYVPVAFVVEQESPQFVQYVRTRYESGLRGPALVTVIEERFRTYGLTEVNLNVVAPRVLVYDNTFIPQVVRTRVAEVKRHPHGGPPGQLKKVAGVQTGAEIVHGKRVERHIETGDRNEKTKPKIKAKEIRDADKSPKANRGGGKDDGGAPGQSKGKGKGKG